MNQLFQLALLVCFAVLALGQYEYDYSYGYDSYDGDLGDDFGGDSSYSSYGGDGFGGAGAGADAGTGFGGSSYGGYYDEYGYYGDEDTQYYEYYGYYADDFAGYEDYYAEEYDMEESCSVDSNGKAVLADGSASCNIKVVGVNKQADKLKGGIDGIYALTTCYNGKPLYRRKDSLAGEDRVLWYSSTFGDWDISKGAEPNEADILVYGGEMEHASAPLFVTNWHLAGDLKSGTGLGEDDYSPIKMKVSCADGKVYKEDSVTRVTGPVLTDEEMEAKYRFIYDKYSRNTTPSPTLNFTFVVLFVMIGLTIVLAIPYFLLKKKGGSGGKKSLTQSFAQMLHQSKKKASGHAL